MTTPDDNLPELLSTLMGEDLSDDESRQLEQRLLDDPAARRAYLDHFVLSSYLEMEHRTADALSRLVDAEGTQVEKQASEPQAQHASLSPHTTSRRFRASRHKLSISIVVAVAVVTTGLLALHFMEIGPFVASEGGQEGGDNQEVVEPEFIAKLTNRLNDAWGEESRPPLRDPRLELGRRLVLSAGLAEITFETGARVILEGPAEFVIGGTRLRSDVDGPNLKDTNSGFLRHGKLVARVEGEDAEYFRIDTPTARVTDLGTEFGVQVAPGGATSAEVFEGAVDIRAALGDAHGPPLRLLKGDAAQVSDSDRRVVSVDPSGRFVRKVPVFDPSVPAIVLWGIHPITKTGAAPNNSNVKTTLAEHVRGTDGDAYGKSAVGLTRNAFDTKIDSGANYIRHNSNVGTTIDFATGYTEFTITAEEGYRLSLSSLSFESARGNEGGMRGFEVYGKAEGAPGPDDLLLDVDDETGTRQIPMRRRVDLRGSAYQEIRSITFRFYPLTDASGRTIDIANMKLRGVVEEESDATQDNVQTSVSTDG